MEIWHGIDRNLSMCGSVFGMGRLTRVTAPAAILHASRDEEEDPPFQKPKAKGRGTLPRCQGSEVGKQSSKIHT